MVFGNKLIATQFELVGMNERKKSPTKLIRSSKPGGSFKFKLNK
jgi:hypothetical protein